MSQTSIHSQPQQTSQTTETRSESFHIPDGPPQPHSKEEIAQLQAQRHPDSDKDSNSEQKQAVGPDEELSNEKARELGLPEQAHAGKIGYGPEYFNMNHVTLGEKIQGVKEEVLGHIKRDPGLVTQGKERRTGELKKKEKEEKDHDPFADPQEQAGQQSPGPDADDSTNRDQQPNTNTSPTTGDQNNADPSTVKFANGQTGQTNHQPARADIDSDRRQVQEEQQAGQTRDVDLKTAEGRLNPDEHSDKGIERAAEL